MSIIIGIDPGPVESAWVKFGGSVLDFGDTRNEDMLQMLAELLPFEHAAIESLSYQGGRAGVGKDTFDTAIWIGRFYQVIKPGQGTLITRNAVKGHVVRRVASGDADVRKALIARFGPVGTAKNPGPLYGMADHKWAALAVAIVHFDRLQTEQLKEAI